MYSHTEVISCNLFQSSPELEKASIIIHIFLKPMEIITGESLGLVLHALVNCVPL